MIRILLVEDDPAQLKRMSEILAMAFPDYVIYKAKGLTEALKKIQELQAISLAVVDYLLNDGTGYDLLKYCQDHLTNVPVIIITAYGKDDEQDVRAALSFQKGAFDFMHKPIDFDELIQRIVRALRITEELV
jgi:two-component system, NtrC family, response regulator PilR